LKAEGSLFGMDYNIDRLAKARMSEGYAGLANGSLISAPFRDETWDVILCNHVLEHIQEDEKALNELSRVLRQNGLLILGVPNEGCMLARLRNHIIQPKISATTDHVNFYIEDSIISKIIKAKLSVVKVETEGFFVPHLRISGFLGARRWGRTVTALMKNLFPSQAAGLTIICRKK